jgi:hypothetical protein
MTQLAFTYDRHSAVAAPTEAFAASGVIVVPSWPEAAGDWTHDVQRRLNRLTNLLVGWDGYHGKPVSPLTAHFAWNLLSSVMRPTTPIPSLVPVAGGGLQIEWHEGGLDIELYVAKPMKAELYVAYGEGQPTLERELTADFSELSAALAHLG